MELLRPHPRLQLKPVLSAQALRSGFIISIHFVRLSYVNAGRVLNTVEKRFRSFGFPLLEDRNLLSPDDSTLFTCSGMQGLKERFSKPDGGRYGSVQSCLRTTDLELVGDGSHLTFFEMIGNFSFGNHDYESSCELWILILKDLGIQVDTVHVHPDQPDHRRLWQSLNFRVVDDIECIWSDGKIGGYCCEMYVQELEIGNLVHTLGHSVDVGFGLERLVQVLEGKQQVDDTSLFRQDIHSIGRDHSRTLTALFEQGLKPGYSGRSYIVRRLLRRLLSVYDPHDEVYQPWVEPERNLMQSRLSQARRVWRRHQSKSPEWWFETFGILPEEIALLSERDDKP